PAFVSPPAPRPSALRRRGAGLLSLSERIGAMTPAARVQTAIELLDAVIAAAVGQGPPADRILADWFRANRFAGSKDRQAIRDLVYRAVRACGPIPQGGRAAMLRLGEEEPALLLHFDGSR